MFEINTTQIQNDLSNAASRELESITQNLIRSTSGMVDLYSKQIEGMVQNSIFNVINQMGLKIPNATLRRVVSRVAEEAAVMISFNVNTSGNSILNTNPLDMIGLSTPFNITTGNLGSFDISNNMFGLLNKQFSSTITNTIANKLESQLALLMPPGALGSIISTSNLITTISNLLTPTIEQSISVALGGFTDSIFTNPFSPVPIVPSIDVVYRDSQGAAALEEVNRQYSSSLAGRSFEQTKNFSVLNRDNSPKLVTLNQGFIDPNANFPRQDYRGSIDTNKLAQGDIRGTIVQKKNASRMIGAKLPGGESFDQPMSPFQGRYPHNKVTETESGHVIEIDDTPGSERLHIYHKSGTFIEIDSTGTTVERITGSAYKIIDKNGKLSITGQADISINGGCKVFIGGSADIEVIGDTNLTCHNDATVQAGGKLNLSGTEEINLASENINIEAYNDLNVKVGNNTKIFSGIDTHIRSSRDNKVQSGRDTHIRSSERFLTQSKNHHARASNDMFLNPSNNINMRVGNQYRLDANSYHVEDDLSQNGTSASGADNASRSNIGILPGRIDYTPLIIQDPSPLNIIDRYSNIVEDEFASSEEIQEHENVLIQSGIATKSTLQRAPLVTQRASINSIRTEIIEGDEILSRVNDLPGNFNLSPNFTLEMVSTKAAVSSYRVEGDAQNSYSQIVGNLQRVCLNILEPAYALYPNMIITSGYRSRDGSTSTSQHLKGQAVDLQFVGIRKSEYFDVARQLAQVLNYDQFLLEYTNYSNNPWIHISFVGDNNRKQVLTFWNNRTHSQGLANLT